MSNIVMILNIVVLLGLVVSAIMACHFEKLLSSVIALGVTGIFAAAEFLILQAPDVAISEQLHCGWISRCSLTFSGQQ